MSNRGFTLIELIVVIVVLSLLAVTALPRLMSVSSEAHDASAKSVFAAFKGAVSQFHSTCMARGGDIPGQGALGIGGGLDFPDLGVRSSTSGSCYPEAGLGDGRISDFADCLQTVEGLLSPLPRHNDTSLPHTQAAYEAAADSIEMVIHYAGVRRCDLTYVAGGAGLNGPTLSYNGQTGAIQISNL
ncbi:type II secretion system protein [Ferrimonas kyonanensis]|uniref:type II secretion system protein n=1 Tax=Ferrimonas kyonanensis TaxID=364763 RepID=UPI00040C835A|nr:prepilin-type N-terminal cleavage/methylation domain-containing protein [Ferrimonas kyonanensis]